MYLYISIYTKVIAFNIISSLAVILSFICQKVLKQSSGWIEWFEDKICCMNMYGNLKTYTGEERNRKVGGGIKKGVGRGETKENKKRVHIAREMVQGESKKDKSVEKKCEYNVHIIFCPYRNVNIINFLWI